MENANRLFLHLSTCSVLVSFFTSNKEITLNVVTFEPTSNKTYSNHVKFRQKFVYCIRILVNDLVSEWKIKEKEMNKIR